MEQITAIALVAGIATLLANILGKVLDNLFGLISKQFSKSNKDGKQEVEIAVIDEKLRKIETNDLAHINVKLDVNATEHRDIFIGLSEIKTTQGLILEKLKEIHK